MVAGVAAAAVVALPKGYESKEVFRPGCLLHPSAWETLGALALTVVLKETKGAG